MDKQVSPPHRSRRLYRLFNVCPGRFYYYGVGIYICITNTQAQITLMALVGIWPPHPSRR